MREDHQQKSQDFFLLNIIQRICMVFGIEQDYGNSYIPFFIIIRFWREVIVNLLNLNFIQECVLALFKQV